MQNISFQDNNLEEFTINGDPGRVIRFDPSDVGIMDRLGIFKQQLQEKFAQLEAANADLEIRADMDAEETERLFDRVTALTREVNEFIRQQINYIFDSEVADVVFGNQSPLSTVKGVTLAERFLNAVTPIIEKTLKKEQQASSKRVSKYTARYHK